MPAAQTVLITGASSGFGRLAAEALARAGHTAIAGLRATEGRNASVVAGLDELARRESVALSAVELDVVDQTSVDAAVDTVLSRHGRLDVVIHNAGHMVLGPAEAFTVEQHAALYDVNVLGTQRVNRAVLPHLRAQRSGLLLWIGSTSHRGGHPPFLGPYFAAKAGMDALAESYASELIRFGIETSILVPGAFTSGTNHFVNASTPADSDRAAAYEEDYGQLQAELPERLGALVPEDADVQSVADGIVRTVGQPAGTRPYRSHIDPSRDGCEVVNVVADRIRAEFFHRAGIADLLSATASL